MYLVYCDSFHGSIGPLCICNTAADAEEMCLAFHQEDEYDRFFVKLQLNLPRAIPPISYNYKEVPFIG